MSENLDQIDAPSAPSSTAGSQQENILVQLARHLSRIGYGEYYASFFPQSPRPEVWCAHLEQAPIHLQPLIQLLLLNESVNPENLSPTMQQLIAPLCEIGLLNELEGEGSSGLLHARGLSVIPVHGNWLICQAPQVDQTLYFGDDSLALINRLRPIANGDCLDLCAGPGIQSLYCARFARSVTAVEINPVAAWLAELNACMNGLSDKISVLRGDLFAPVTGRQFDTIVSNPPLLPFPEHVEYPFVGHGGVDGMRITWRILDGLPDALTDRGKAQIIGATLSDGILPYQLHILVTWSKNANMDVLMTIIGHQPLHPGSQYFEGLIRTASEHSGTERRIVKAAFQALLEEYNASGLCTFFLHITRGVGSLELLDVAEEPSHGLWYV